MEASEGVPSESQGDNVSPCTKIHSTVGAISIVGDCQDTYPVWRNMGVILKAMLITAIVNQYREKS